MPRFRVALVGATIAAFAAPLVPSVAHATTAVPTLVYAADIDRDGYSGLYRAPANDPTNKTAILPDDGTVAVVKAKLSPDGSRIAVLADFNAASPSDSGVNTLVTMNLDGTNRRTIATEVFTATSTGFAENFVDGFDWASNSQVIFGWFVYTNAMNAPTEKLRVESQAGGTATDFPSSAGLGQPAVSADGSQIAAIDSLGLTSTLYVFPSSSAASKQTLATEGTTFLTQPTWSPDGANIAFVRDESDSTYDASQIDVVHYDSGTSTWGAATTAVAVVKGSSSALIDIDPTWTDSSTLMFERVDDSSTAAPSGGYTPVDLWTATNSGTWGAPAQFTNTPSIDEWSPTEAPADTTLPSAVTFVPFILNGTSVTVRWTTPDADYSHVTLHRFDGTTTTDIPNVTGTSYVDKNLVVGHTYTYTADTFDGAGNQASTLAGEWAVTPTKPAAIVVVSPTSTLNRGKSFLVTWGVSGQPSGTTYDVDYAVKSGSTWALGSAVRWITGTAANSAVFTSGVPGQTYYFRATVHDQHGNVASTAWRGANVPFDQKSGSFSSGWTTIGNSKLYWLGSIAATSINGKTFTISPTAKSVSIIGTKCAACGKFAVYVDGHYRGTYSSASNTLKVRQVLWTGTYLKIGKHTVKVVAVLGAHQTLQIDGVADPR